MAKQKIVKKRNLGLVVVILLFPVVLGFGLYFLYLFTSPQHALAKAHEAIKAKEPEKFKTYVAVDSLTQNLILALKGLRPETLQKLMGAEAATEFAALSAEEVKRELDSELQLYITKTLGDDKKATHQLLAKLSLLDLQFAGVESLEEGDKEAEVVIRLASFGGRMVVMPNLTIKHNKDNWEIIEVVNLNQVIKRLAGEME